MFQPLLQYLALPSLIGKQGFYPAKTFQDRLILLLQAFEPAVEVVEVPHDFPETIVMLGKFPLHCPETIVDSVKAPVDPAGPKTDLGI